MATFGHNASNERDTLPASDYYAALGCQKQAIKITHTCSICGYGYNYKLVEFQADGTMECGHHWTDLVCGLNDLPEFSYIGEEDLCRHTARRIDWAAILD